jgi:hyperosmotically inducible protein
MMMKIVLAAVVLTAGFACKNNPYKRDEESMRTSYERNTAADNYKDADNTAMNKRDLDETTLTPMDQRKGSEADIALTTKIREVITDEDSLSMKAHNVKIITLQGKTTLRGPVETWEEKRKVEQLARKAGAKSIDNQLDVTTKTE